MVSACDDTTVAIGLLDEAVHPFDSHIMKPVQFLIPLHRSKIGGGEEARQ